MVSTITENGSPIPFTQAQLAISFQTDLYWQAPEVRNGIRPRKPRLWLHGIHYGKIPYSVWMFLPDPTEEGPCYRATQGILHLHHQNPSSISQHYITWSEVQHRPALQGAALYHQLWPSKLPTNCLPPACRQELTHIQNSNSFTSTSQKYLSVTQKTCFCLHNI